MSAIELSLTDIMDKLVVRRLGPVQGGMFGSQRRPCRGGKLSEATLHGELGEIVCGKKTGGTSDEETILFWHRGLSSPTSPSARHAQKARGWESARACAMPRPHYAFRRISSRAAACREPEPHDARGIA